MKIKTKDGVIDLSTKGGATEKETPKTKAQETEKRIESRGKIQDKVKTLTSDDSKVRKAIAGAELLDAPFASVESGIANVGLEAQRGNKALTGSPAMAGPAGLNPGNAGDAMKAVEQAILGFSLQKQGQYGDIMKQAGFNPILSDTAGMVLHLSPVKIYSEVARTFGAISKMSDKAMLKAGNNLLAAVNDAKTASGVKLSQEFAKDADNIAIDGIEFLDDVQKLPEAAVSRAEEVFGNMSDLASGLTIGKLREFKRFLGKLRPNAFGQGERGLKESFEVKDLNAVYSNLKARMTSVIGKQLGEERARYLLSLEDAYSDIVDAGRYIRRQVVEPTTREATRVGQFAQKVGSDLDMTGRRSLSSIKAASRQAAEKVGSAMKQIERFNNNQKIRQAAGHAVNAAIYGGVAGGIGGRILRSAQGDS